MGEKRGKPPKEKAGASNDSGNDNGEDNGKGERRRGNEKVYFG